MHSTELRIAILSLCGITLHLVAMVFVNATHPAAQIPLYVVFILGGIPLVWELGRKALRGEFGSDLLAGLSIVTSVFLDQCLAGAFVVLMLSGGTALERYASGKASAVLQALAKRMPQIAKRRVDGKIEEINSDQVAVGDILVVPPQDICPVDGVVIEGNGTMDEAFLTGEPYEMSKAPGSEVISGAINGEGALVIRAVRKVIDSRYARIAKVMDETQHKRVSLRRLGDQLGAFYTPVALIIAFAAWYLSGDAVRFLAVLVIATPCPLLIAIPVTIIGSISLAAKRGIIIKDPAVLERVETCRTIILDKTGTLTYGTPLLSEEIVIGDIAAPEMLALAAGAEQYSKHPLATAVVRKARANGITSNAASEVHQEAGVGLWATVMGHSVLVTSRKVVSERKLPGAEKLPPSVGGLECVLVVDDNVQALYRFRDEPRHNTLSFIEHLGSKHKFSKVMIVSGDREEEVRHLAERVGISQIYGGKSPEEKVAIVAHETTLAPTLFMGDGINDAPALLAATVGVAFGHQSDITSEAAGAVIMDTSLEKVDEFFHIARRMRIIALQCAIGGMVFSIAGMVLAAYGMLTPVAGAIGQEFIDLFAVLNALRVALIPKKLVDF